MTDLDAVNPENKEDMKRMDQIFQIRDYKQVNSAFVDKFLEKIPYFKKLRENIPPDFFMKYCKRFEIKKFKSLEEVIKFGDTPKYFYILVTGQVYVLIQRSGIKVQDKQKNAYKPRMDEVIKTKLIPTMALSKKSSPLDGFRKPNIRALVNRAITRKHASEAVYLLQNYPEMICVRNLKAPTTFGDLSIERDRVGKRTATIISKGKSVMFAFPLNIFRKIKRYMDDPEGRQKASFFHKVSIFRHWSMTNIVELMFHLKKRVIRNGTFLFNIGDTDNNIYVIRKGKFQLKYRIMSDIDKAYVDKRIVKLMKVEKRIMQDYQDIPVAILGEYEVIGFYEFYEKIKKKVTSLQSITDEGEIYSINGYHFFTLVTNPITLKIMKQLHQNQVILMHRKVNLILKVAKTGKLDKSESRSIGGRGAERLYNAKLRDDFSSMKVTKLEAIKQKRNSVIETELARKIFKMSVNMVDTPKRNAINERARNMVENRLYEWVSDKGTEDSQMELSDISDESINSLFYDKEKIKHIDNKERKLFSCQKYLEKDLRRKLKAMDRKKRRQKKQAEVVDRSSSINRQSKPSNQSRGRERVRTHSSQLRHVRAASTENKRKNKGKDLKERQERSEQILQRIIGVSGNLKHRFLNQLELGENGKNLKKKLDGIKQGVKNRFKDEFDIVEYLKEEQREKMVYDPNLFHRFYSNGREGKFAGMTAAALKALTHSLTKKDTDSYYSNKRVDNKPLYKVLSKAMASLGRRDELAARGDGASHYQSKYQQSDRNELYYDSVTGGGTVGEHMVSSKPLFFKKGLRGAPGGPLFNSSQEEKGMGSLISDYNTSSLHENNVNIRQNNEASKEKNDAGADGGQEPDEELLKELKNDSTNAKEIIKNNSQKKERPTSKSRKSTKNKLVNKSTDAASYQNSFIPYQFEMPRKRYNNTEEDQRSSSQNFLFFSKNKNNTKKNSRKESASQKIVNYHLHDRKVYAGRGVPNKLRIRKNRPRKDYYTKSFIGMNELKEANQSFQRVTHQSSNSRTNSGTGGRMLRTKSNQRGPKRVSRVHGKSLNHSNISIQRRKRSGRTTSGKRSNLKQRYKIIWNQGPAHVYPHTSEA